MLIRGSAGSFKCKIRWLHISLDLHNHAHNEVASVWVFLGGAGSWSPGISNIYLLSICVQRIGIFCCKTAEKIKKIKKKISAPWWSLSELSSSGIRKENVIFV